MSDNICIKNTNSIFFQVPVEPASDPRFVKHVSCEGARFHVLYWDSLGCHCSEKSCIINKRHGA